MICVERAVRIEAPIEVAWEILGDFSLRELVADICTHVDVKGSGVGAVRTMHLAPRFGSGYVQERLESLDERDHYMTYRMVDSGPVPFADYIGSIRLTPAGPAACVAVMTSRFVPVELDDETARSISVTNIETALKNAREAIGRRMRAPSV
jgi:hypothetical protein